MSITPIKLEQAIQRQNKHVIDNAWEAFWASVAKDLPHVTTGDFPPDAHAIFKSACAQAVATWRLWNDPIVSAALDAREELDELATQVLNLQ